MFKPLTRIGPAPALWLLLVAVSFGFLFHYKSRPSQPAADAPIEWPADARLEAPGGNYRLVVAIHPHCPCSRATLRELGRLLAQCPNVKTDVLIWKPRSEPAGWEKSDLWGAAEQLPRCTITVDEDGREAERFGARTSGQTFLWGKDGKLLFQGGITASRGHEGDSPGLQALRALIRGESTQYSSAPVFGCSLTTPDSESNS